MTQQIGGIVVDTISAGAFQLLAAITARKQSNTQRTRASRREQIPDAVADYNRIADLYAEFLSRREKQIRIGLRMMDQVARDDRNFTVYTEQTKRQPRALEASARRDRPRHVRCGEIVQQLRCARPRAHLPPLTF